MIDHIKLAEGVGGDVWCPINENVARISFTHEQFQAYTNAILEYAAVKCEMMECNSPHWKYAGDVVAEAIRQEKV